MVLGCCLDLVSPKTIWMTEPRASRRGALPQTNEGERTFHHSERSAGRTPLTIVSGFCNWRRNHAGAARLM